MKKLLILLLLLPFSLSATKKISILFDPRTQPIVEGAGKTFGIRLDEAPSSDVTVSFGAANGYITFSASLTFTAANFATPQSFTMTGASDGVVEGLKVETVTLTASGGGYSTTKVFNINVTDTGLDEQFVKGYNWLHREYNGITIVTSGDITTKRAALVSHVFNGAGLPTDDTPTAISTGFTGTMGQTTTGSLVGASSVNRLQWNFTDNTAAVWTSYVYHIFASTPNGKVAFVHGGHSSELYHLNIINELLADGFDIAYCFMPSTFQNTETNTGVTGTGVSAHNGILSSALDSGSFNALELFFYDKIKTLNYFDTNYSYTEEYITGCSGGGWAVVMLMAMDTRFDKGVSVRGTKPVPFRSFTDASATADWDFEQGPVVDFNGTVSPTGFNGSRVRDLYQSVTVFDQYILASSGNRELHLSHHAADSCCHGKFTYTLWKSWLISYAAGLGCNFDLTLDTNGSYTTHGWNTNDRAIIDTVFN